MNDKRKLLRAVKDIYTQKGNMMHYLRKTSGNDQNSVEDILISYDLQAGNYIRYYNKNKELKHKFSVALAEVLNRLGNVDTLLEAGVGEATTLGPLLTELKTKPEHVYAFDLSWSRMKYARKFLKQLNIHDVHLFTGDMFCAPLKDDSIDIVYTVHAIEPNGGREREALQELYRIANQYLILLEPSYEFANEKARERMMTHGYITNLYGTAKELGYNIIEHRLFDVSLNLLNPTGLMIIKKNEIQSKDDNPLCCPITKMNIVREDSALYSEESMLAYPVIDDIPCLLPQNAIVATHFLDSLD